MAELVVGDKVSGKKFGSLEHDFAGDIEKVYENSVLVHITDFDESDRVIVNEMNQRAIVRKSEAKIVK